MTPIRTNPLPLLTAWLLAPLAAVHADDSGAKKPNVLFVDVTDC